MKRLPLTLVRACALCCALALTSLTAAAQNPPPAAAGGPRNELDAFMEKVLARREVNRKTLDQYILDEAEFFEILGPGRSPLYRTKRGSVGTGLPPTLTCTPSGPIDTSDDSF